MTTVVVPVWISRRLPPSKKAAVVPRTRVIRGVGLMPPPYMERLREHAGSLETETGSEHPPSMPAGISQVPYMKRRDSWLLRIGPSGSRKTALNSWPFTYSPKPSRARRPATERAKQRPDPTDASLFEKHLMFAIYSRCEIGVNSDFAIIAG
jgi:hypothetical protein